MDFIHIHTSRKYSRKQIFAAFRVNAIIFKYI